MVLRLSFHRTRTVARAVRGSPAWRKKEDLLASVPGVGPTIARTLIAELPELGQLAPQDARVYLGAIHNMARFKERLATARKYLPEFGLGAYCGFGRLPPSELSQVLAHHLAAVELAARG